MLPYKVRTGGHLLGCLLGGLGRSILRHRPRTSAAAVYRSLILALMAIGAMVSRRGKCRIARLVELTERSGAPREWLLANPEAVAILAEEQCHCHRFEAAIQLLKPFLERDPGAAKLLAVRALAHLGLGHYPEALAAFTRVAQLRPTLARDMNYEHYRCYLLGLRNEVPAARQAMAAQLLESGFSGPPEGGLARFLHDRLRPRLDRMGLQGTIGVIIGNFHSAFGHAILDPFHYLQLFRQRFDHLVFVHPPYVDYSPAMRISAIILDPYVEQIETTDRDVLSFAWQNLGELTHDNVTFLVHHYWSLNRLAFLARQDPNHPMSRGRRYLRFPPKLAVRAERILDRHGFDFSRPLAVVHTREHGYHALPGQRFRNTDIRNYIPALKRLVELGCQVVRIGDRKMMPVQQEVPRLIELPTWDDYDPVLDPYLISRCRFMISCQSGPCSYARVFGKPNLVLNAVYHHTLIPERQELLGFKQYRKATTDEPMDVDAIFGAGAHLFDRTEQFDAAGITLQEMTSEEILCATEEMLDWLDDPLRPATIRQKQFRKRMRWHAAQHPLAGNPLATPMNDYIGYALPECRISDAVCQVRIGILPMDHRKLQAA